MSGPKVGNEGGAVIVLQITHRRAVDLPHNATRRLEVRADIRIDSQDMDSSMDEAKHSAFCAARSAVVIDVGSERAG